MKLVGIQNVSIVEPYIESSTLGGQRIPSSNIRFRDLFDLEAFNRISRAEGAAEIVPYSTYLRHAPQRAIYVIIQNLSIKNHPSPTLPPPELVWAAPEGGEECYQPEKDSRIIPPVYPDGHSYCYFRVIRAYHRPLYRKAISAKQLQSTVLGGLELKGFTLVLSYWRTPWRLGGCPMITVTPPKISDSPHVLDAVTKFEKKMKFADGQYVAVMLRSEHAYLMIQSHIRFKRPSGYTVQKCLEETMEKTRATMTELNAPRVFMTADVGLYGSNSWRETLRKNYKEKFQNITHQVQGAVEEMYGGPFQEWEQGFTDILGSGLKDSVIVAAVQRVLASRAACLILLGGGSFQRMALASYIHQAQPTKFCVRMVCMDRAYEGQFTQQIEQYQT